MRKWLLPMLVSGLLLGCGERDWQTKDISGLMPPLAFELIDEHGNAVTAEAFRGQATLLFFGFTHCHDVCPTTLARLTAIIEGLDEEVGDKVQVLFVSVDPARDDPATLRRYTEAFGPQVTGLTGDTAALEALTRRYRVTYGYGEPDADGNYAVSHSSAVFAFNDAGQAHLLIRDSDSPNAVASDLRRLVTQG